jgi:hypothetical protein
MAAALLAALVWLESYHAGQAALLMVDELNKLPDEEALNQLPRIVGLGDPAMPALCQALAARPRVADAAQTALLEELARWELLAPMQAGQKLARLAKLLAQQPRSASRSETERRAELAERILAWPAGRLPQMPQIIAHCEAVLEAASRVDGEPQLLADSSHARPLQRAARDSSPARSPAVAVNMETDQILPHEDPIDFVYEPPVTRRESRPPQELSPPATLPVDMSAARPIAAATVDVPTAVEPLPQARANSPPRANQPRLSLADLNHIPLVQLLHSDDAAIASAAREELARRGQSPLAVQLGQQLTDADPGVRARCAAALPQLADFDARPWLLWLSHDESPDVRLVAVALMATSGESQMLRRVKDMASSDADQRVRIQAQRASK